MDTILLIEDFHIAALVLVLVLSEHFTFSKQLKTHLFVVNDLPVTNFQHVRFDLNRLYFDLHVNSIDNPPENYNLSGLVLSCNVKRERDKLHIG